MTDLASRRCVPCREGTPPLAPDIVRIFQADVDPGWRVVDGHHLERAWTFPDFATGLAFVNRVGALADAEGHHPDIHLAWGKVRIEIWTHTVQGLSEADFVLAAKIDRLG